MSAKKIPEKVILEKSGIHVKVTAGPYTKRQLRELLLSSLSLIPAVGSGDREAEFIRLSGVDPDDVRRIKDGEIFGADGKELFEESSKKFAAMKLVNLIANEGKIDVEKDLINLLRDKGISDDLIDQILKNGLTDEMIRLLKALGFTDEEIAELFGMREAFFERLTKSEESCSSTSGSFSEEHMTVEGFYLISHFRNPLTKALGDVLSKKPWNPVEYLGHWLLNYKIREERAKKRKEFDAELQAERERLRIKVVPSIESNLSEPADDEEEEFPEGWNFAEYEGD